MNASPMGLVVQSLRLAISALDAASENDGTDPGVLTESDCLQIRQAIDDIQQMITESESIRTEILFERNLEK